MSDVDDQIARARAAMERIAGDYGAVARTHHKRIRRTAGQVGRKVRNVAIADAAILFAAVVVGLILPGGLGILGYFPAALSFSVNTLLIGFGLLVATLQAYVFAVLTCIYLHDAVHLH